ncbi:MAG: SDR family oxidoreductase [Pseudoxanthomonas suwonensis]|nr:SDR family oxidoreductase [Pseudoxanthomonas suwonensis]
MATPPPATTPFSTALVTGANRGLGLEFVRQLLAAGSHVVATAREPGKANALNGLVAEHPGRLHVLPLDVAEARSRAELVRELPLVIGEAGRIDLLLLNAGVLHAGERFGHLDQAQLEHSVRTNAIGPLLLTQALAPWLAEGARVVAMSSRLGSMACTTRFGTPGYAISKAALNMVVAQLVHALEPQRAVVVAVSPGWARTDMGGPDADVDPVQAVAGLLREAAGLDNGDSGRFFDWKGEAVPW